MLEQWPSERRWGVCTQGELKGGWWAQGNGSDESNFHHCIFRYKSPCWPPSGSVLIFDVCARPWRHLYAAEHPPVLAWHRFQRKDFSRAGQEQVKDEGKHQGCLVQVVLWGDNASPTWSKITNQTCYNITKKTKTLPYCISKPQVNLPPSFSSSGFRSSRFSLYL